MCWWRDKPAIFVRLISDKIGENGLVGSPGWTNHKNHGDIDI